MKMVQRLPIDASKKDSAALSTKAIQKSISVPDLISCSIWQQSSSFFLTRLAEKLFGLI